ncbi:MAG: 23S rRNA (adenine(2503)-C(2))-methyltransferase RlmN, partial [Acidobacteria bacterium]|nr:23S rRNA (adenine(2503)-C(2))-methyltransferase RlmN [Acidobacteriota bacterium]
MADAPPDLAELEPEELELTLSRLGVEPYHGRQVYRWVYRRGLEGFAGITDLPRPLREPLGRNLSFSTPRIAGRELSDDGTRKFLFTLADGR